MKTYIRPNKLEPRAKIGIVNPSYWLEPKLMKRAMKVFENLGYELVFGESPLLRENQYAGTPEQRAADIMNMFKDKAHHNNAYLKEVGKVVLVYKIFFVSVPQQFLLI